MTSRLLCAVSIAALSFGSSVLAQDNNQSAISQSGAGGQATVTQTASSEAMNSAITQTSNGNRATVTQRGLGSGESPTIGSFIEQTGSSNTATVYHNAPTP